MTLLIFIRYLRKGYMSTRASVAGVSAAHAFEASAMSSLAGRLFGGAQPCGGFGFAVTRSVMVSGAVWMGACVLAGSASAQSVQALTVPLARPAGIAFDAQ